MDKTTERKLTQEIERVVSNETPTPFRPSLPLADQLVQMERIEHAIHQRIRTERLAAMADYDRAVVEIRANYERRLSDAIARMQEERDIELRNIGELTSRRLHELGQLQMRAVGGETV